MPKLDILDLSPADAVHQPDLLWQIFARGVDGVVVRGFLPPLVMDGAAAALERDVRDFPCTGSENEDLDVEQVHVLGMTVTPSRIRGKVPYLERYLQSVASFETACRRLFPEGDGFLERIERLLRDWSGGRPTGVFIDPGSGRPYTPSTIRVVPPGCEMPLHSGLDFLSLGIYGDLNAVLDPREQLSFFSVIQAPDAGGELVVYHTDFWDPEKPMQDNGYLDGDAIVNGHTHETVHLSAGDLFVFAGGRWYHRVSPVEGTTTRRTIGGFLGFTKSHDRIWYWS